MRAFLPVPWDPDRWVDTGLPAWVETMMQEGVRIRPEVEPPFADHPFYRWESPEANMRAIMEADRHLSAGSLEYIPFEEVRGVAESTIVHPSGGEVAPLPRLLCGVEPVRRLFSMYTSDAVERASGPAAWVAVREV